MMSKLISLLAGKFGPWLVLGAAGVVASLLVTARWTGYQAGYQKADLECVAANAEANAETVQEILDRLQEYKEAQEELDRVAKEISNKLDLKTDTTVERINRVIEKQPIIVNGDCSIDYGVVELLNNIADGAPSTDR